jgi:hypothetical protein
MIITEATLRQFNQVIKEFSNERIEIAGAPGKIRNNGQNVDVIKVVIGHVPTQKIHEYIYRDLTSNFRVWLKEKVDKIDNK